MRSTEKYDVKLSGQQTLVISSLYLMRGTKMVPAMLSIFNQMTQLTVWEDFINVQRNVQGTTAVAFLRILTWQSLPCGRTLIINTHQPDDRHTFYSSIYVNFSKLDSLSIIVPYFRCKFLLFGADILQVSFKNTFFIFPCHLLNKYFGICHNNMA